MSKKFNGKRVAVRVRPEDDARITTLLTTAGPFSELAGISDVIRLAIKVAAESVEKKPA